MDSFAESMREFKQQLTKGVVQTAYRGLLEYMTGLKTHFEKNHPEVGAGGALYHGYLDMTYFPLFPTSLKQRNLKIAVVFNYEQYRFEAWLSGTNKQVLEDCWKRIKESGWKKYAVNPPGKGIDFIAVSVLAEDPDFGDLEALTGQIDKGVLQFIKDVEVFLSHQETQPSTMR